MTIMTESPRVTCYVVLSDRISLIDIHNRTNLISLEQRRCIQLLSLLFHHGQLNGDVHVIPARNTRAAIMRKYKTEIYKNSKWRVKIAVKASAS